ncbi:MAG: HypC/HybG/HupF family hydrogenase formation chaperone [Calditrichaeota bacterium]|nr:HypC/HybG/HupF family hydrogenase formation chaperone [Calditrichota bacterium]
MCLAVPMKVIEIDGNRAKVEMGGTMRVVGLDIIDPLPKVGDYVIVHAGFVINIIDEAEAQTILHDFAVLFGDDDEVHF